MHWYHVTLIVMALIAVFASYHVKNALLYIGLGVGSYVTSVLWHNFDLPVPVLFGASTNVLVCILIYSRTIYLDAFPRWERGVFRMFIMMLLIDLLYSIGIIHNKIIFSECLEVANGVALLIITCPGALDWLKKYDHGGFMRRWRFMADFHHSLLSSGKAYHFWWKEP